MMNERERLIRLLMSAPTDIMGNRGVGAIADYLLGHGVIVPPAKVGDKLYSIWFNDDDNKYYVDEVEVIDVSAKRAYIEGFYVGWENIGKLDFLAREEAERAIIERELNETDQE